MTEVVSHEMILERVDDVLRAQETAEAERKSIRASISSLQSVINGKPDDRNDNGLKGEIASLRSRVTVGVWLLGLILAGVVANVIAAWGKGSA